MREIRVPHAHAIGMWGPPSKCFPDLRHGIKFTHGLDQPALAIRKQLNVSSSRTMATRNISAVLPFLPPGICFCGAFSLAA